MREFMPDSDSLTTLARWLAGEFSNQQQAFDQPTWFVHLKLWHRPVPHRLDGHVAIFAEQANALYPDQAYRQRLLSLRESEGRLWIQYYGFKNPGQFRGAGLQPEQLQILTVDELEYLSGCVLDIEVQSDRFIGTMRPGDRCRFQYDGKVGQVILGFEVQENQFWSGDRGVDPETEKPIWGALMGKYEFTKTADFSDELPMI